MSSAMTGSGSGFPEDPDEVALRIDRQDAERLRLLLARTVKDLDREVLSPEWDPETRGRFRREALRFRVLYGRVGRALG